jgi:hypothetical protein
MPPRAAAGLTVVAVEQRSSARLGASRSPHRRAARRSRRRSPSAWRRSARSRRREAARAGPGIRERRRLHARRAVPRGGHRRRGRPEGGAAAPTQVCVAEKRFWVALDYAEPHLRRDPEDYRLRFVVASLYATVGRDEGGARAPRTNLAQPARLRPRGTSPIAVCSGTKQAICGGGRSLREYLRLSRTGSTREKLGVRC